MDALEVMTRRVSPRKLGSPAPTPDHLQEMLKAAGAAPDHGRLKPWHFIVIDEAARPMFGELFVKSLLRRAPRSTDMQVEAERKKVERAPVIVVAAATARAHAKIPEIEQVMAAAAATQNLVLAAHALGYGALWRTGAPAYDAVLKRELGLAENDIVIGFIYLGSIEVPGLQRTVGSAASSAWPQRH